MSQSGFTPISIYYSTTASNVPTAANLVPGELAINTADGKLYYEDSSGVVQVLATKSTGSIGGSNTQVQFNNSGSLGGSSGLTWDGSFLTTSSIKNSALTSGRVTYAGASGLLTDSANLTFNGTTLTIANDASINGITAGHGAGGGVSNTVFGASALAANTTGSGVTAFGYNALNLNTSGTGTAFGWLALAKATTADGNTALGPLSLYQTTTGSYNTAVGLQSLQNNTTASNNTAVGYQSLYTNTTGVSNTAVGYQAGYSGVTGQQSVFIGYQAGYADTGGFSTLVGYQAGSGKTTGDSSTLIGRFAGQAAGSHQSQTFVGDSAGSQTIGSNNTFFGVNSGYLVTTGAKNTIIGSYSGNQGGLDIRTASNYIVLSDGDGNPRGIFDGSGNFLVGTTSSISSGTSIVNLGVGRQALTVKGDDANSYTQGTWSATTSGDNLFTYFATEASITVRGSVSYNRAGGVVLYNTTSDYRAKDISRLITDSGSVIDSIPVYMGKMHGATQERPMFIAHETPTYAHTGEKDAVDADGKPVYQQMDASALIPVMWAEIQSLRKRVAQLESK